jgi:hypothetical protein
VDERGEVFPVSLTILYRNPQRPGEGGMTMIAGQTEAAAMIKRLEKRGFEIVKITYAPFTEAPPLPARQSQRRGN